MSETEKEAKILEEQEQKTTEETEHILEKLDSLPIYDLSGKIAKKIPTPKIFNTPIRFDLIKRAVVAVQTTRIQPKGRDPMAGKRTTAESRGVGLGIARVPRVKGERYSKAGLAAFAPGTVGGRLSHPPRAEKIILKKINAKERRLAIRSAIAATAKKELIQRRGHKIDDVKHIPLIVIDDLENLKETKAVLDTLSKLGLNSEIDRIKTRRKIRAGKGKMRGRKIKWAKGPLIIINEDNGIGNASSNIPGIDVIPVNRLNAELLAPGTHPGRLTIWTESAIRKLVNDQLFNSRR
jgi:large subunit ribosomal protein L4e